MRLFKCNDAIKTYKYPIFKIVLSNVLIALMVCNGYIFPINNNVWKIFVRVICTLIAVLCVLCVYISCAEIILLCERKRMANIDVVSANKKAKECQIDFVLSLLESNDIIEIAIVANNQIIEFGTSSNSLNGSSCLFDKKYYVDGKEYVTIEDVKTTIDNYM